MFFCIDLMRINHNILAKKNNMRKLYFLVGPLFELTNENCKHLLYVTIIKPISEFCCSTVGLCRSKSKIDVIQRCQNIAFGTIDHHCSLPVRNKQCNSPWYDAANEIQRFSHKQKTRLDHHVNPSAIQLLDNSKDIRCLKRLKPCDLVSDFRLRH